MIHTIYTEAGHDAAFIKAYLESLFGENILNSHGINFIPTGGWTKMNLVANEFKKTTDQGGTNIVIFDADFPINHGSFATRQTELLARAEELEIEFELFLFPNNNGDGDFESLLEKIVCLKHSAVLKCFDNYESCLVSKNTADFTYITPSRKAKIYSYVEAITTPKDFEKARKEDHFLYYSEEHWNLEDDYLIPLKQFLTSNLHIAE